MPAIPNIFEELIKEQGDKVWVDTARCQIWKIVHNGCTGCPSALGCGKVAELVRFALLFAIYQPSSYEDFEKMLRRKAEIYQRILKAKTLEELKAIPKI